MGIALLAKAPLHLFFFYAIVVAVLWQTREWASLWHPAHAAGLILMAAIFALWWFPYHRDPVTAQAAQVWQKQMEDRLTGQFHFTSWVLNIPRGLSNHLPWLLLAPLLWRRDLEKLGARDAAIFRGTRLAVVICFFGLLLFPGVLPRYTMPLSLPFALLLAIVVADSRLAPPSFALRAWWRSNTALAILLLVAACAGPIAIAIGQRRHVLDLHVQHPTEYAALVLWPLVGSGAAIVLSLAAFVGRMKLARPALIATSSGALIAAAMIPLRFGGRSLHQSHRYLASHGGVINELFPRERAS